MTESDRVELLEGLRTTRAIRRYTDEPIPETTLRDILFSAYVAPFVEMIVPEPHALE